MSSMVPCLHPSICGVQAHRAGTNSARRCASLGGAQSTSTSVPTSITTPPLAQTQPEPDSEQDDDKSDLFKKLDHQLEAITTSDGWKQYLRASNMFPQYSLNNRLLIMAQMPEATRVAGYGTFRKMNRQVQKGNLSRITIFGPPKEFTWTEVDDDTGEEVERTQYYHKAHKVFDISQTEIIDPDKPDPMKYEYPTMTDEDEQALFDKVVEYGRSHKYFDAAEIVIESHMRAGVKEDIRLSDNGSSGYNVTRDIKVSGESPGRAAYQLLTYCVIQDLNTEAEKASRKTGTPSIIAESHSIAYLVADKFGVDSSSVTVPSVAQYYSEDPDVLKSKSEEIVSKAEVTYQQIMDYNDDELPSFWTDAWYGVDTQI